MIKNSLGKEGFELFQNIQDKAIGSNGDIVSIVNPPIGTYEISGQAWLNPSGGTVMALWINTTSGSSSGTKSGLNNFYQYNGTQYCCIGIPAYTVRVTGNITFYLTCSQAGSASGVLRMKRIFT